MKIFLCNFSSLVFTSLDPDLHPDLDPYRHFWDPGSGSAWKLLRIRNTAFHLVCDFSVQYGFDSKLDIPPYLSHAPKLKIMKGTERREIRLYRIILIDYIQIRPTTGPMRKDGVKPNRPIFRHKTKKSYRHHKIIARFDVIYKNNKEQVFV